MRGEIMNVNSIKKVVKKEGDEYELVGTCFFINEKVAITARHVVKDKNNLLIEFNSEIYLCFEAICHDKYDFALLIVNNSVTLNHVYTFDASKIYDGEEWKTFGFPYKKIKGDLLCGIVSIPETISDDLYDIDLKMVPDSGLSDYRGISGSPVIIDDYVKAILVRKPDGISLGGVKIENCIDLLLGYNLKFIRNHSVWLECISHSEFNNDGKLSIERRELLKEIEQFAINGNGLVIGDAGVGKSYIMKRLQNELNQRGIPTIYIAIDNFACASDQEFRDEFNLKAGEELIYKLQRELSRVQLVNQKAVIIFDSFDSARNDVVKQKFLNLIKKLKEKLNGTINIIVSCRIHDARVSPSLQELFPVYLKDENNQDIHCRYFTIHELTDLEVKDSVEQLGISKEIYIQFSENLKVMLRNPFNLWLLEKCFEVSKNVSELSSLDSEIQLLDRFWDNRVNGVRKDTIEAILYEITRRMVLDRSLTVSKREIFKIDIQEEWNVLLRNSIIKYSNKLNNKISFSHNILFDYAVAKVLLTDKLENFIHFIEEDTSRVIFLRPSLMYFFNSLWFYEREEFWHITFEVMSSIKLPTITKFIPIHTIIIDSKNIDDLTPLISRWNNSEQYSNKIIKYILEAVDVFRVLDKRIWIDFINILYVKKQDEHVGLIAYNLRKIIDLNQVKDDVTIKRICGNISRYLYLEFKDQDKLKLDNWKRNIAVGSLIPIICKTYSTNKLESEEIIKSIIDAINPSGDNVDLVSAITHNIKSLFTEDYDISEYVYRKIHSAHVTSSETTNINASNILPLTSNRRQDFDMCKFNLYSDISKIIGIKYEQGLRLALRTLNSLVLQHRTNYKTKSNICVNINNRLVHIESDGSCWWASGYIDQEIGAYTKAVIEKLDNIALQGDLEQIDKFIEIVLEEVSCAFLWGRILSFGASKPQIFCNILFDFCTTQEALFCKDLIYYIGIFINKCCRYIDRGQLSIIEKAIHDLRVNDEINEEEIERLKKRLILCIDRDLLLLPESLKLLQELGDNNESYKNRPSFEFRVENVEYSYETDLRRMGIDLNENIEVMEKLTLLNNANKNVLNRYATLKEVDEILPITLSLFNMMTSEFSKILEKEIWNQIGKGIENSLKGELKNNRVTHFDNYKNVLTRIVELKYFCEPETNFENLYKGYVSSPKHIASELLPLLIAINNDQDIINAIEMLDGQISGSAKCILINNLYRIGEENSDYLWSKLESISKVNESPYTECLIECLKHLLYTDNDRVIKILRMVCNDNTNAVNNGIGIILYLYLNGDNEWINELIAEILINPLKYQWDGPDGITANLFEFIKYDKLNNTDKEKVSKILSFLNSGILQLMKLLEYLDNEIKTHLDDNTLIEKFRETYKIFDWILDNLYFKSGALEEKEKVRQPLMERKYYFLIKPLIRNVINTIDKSDNPVIFAPTIHHLVQMLNYQVEFDMKEIIYNIKVLINSGKKVGYVGDSLAVDEMVRFMDKLFADYKYNLQEEDVLKNVLNILDCFAEIGSTKAINYIWRLEEIFR